MPPNICNDSEDGTIAVHTHNSHTQWVIVLWKEINGFEPDVPPFFFTVGSNCLLKSNEHQLRTQRDEKMSCVFQKHNEFFCFNKRIMATSALTIWFFCVADYRVHVLRHHAEQVGTADLSAWLHEEPPGVPPWPPRTSVALLQLHVYARWVRSSVCWRLQNWFS